MALTFLLILVSWQHTGNCDKLPTLSSKAPEISVVTPAKSKQWQWSPLPNFSLWSSLSSYPLTAYFSPIYLEAMGRKEEGSLVIF